MRIIDKVFASKSLKSQRCCYFVKQILKSLPLKVSLLHISIEKLTMSFRSLSLE